MTDEVGEDLDCNTLLNSQWQCCHNTEHDLTLGVGGKDGPSSHTTGQPMTSNFSSAEQQFNNGDDNDSGDMETSADRIEWECSNNVELYLLLRRPEIQLRARASWLAGGDDTGFGRRSRNPNPQYIIDLQLVFDQWLRRRSLTHPRENSSPLCVSSKFGFTKTVG